MRSGTGARIGYWTEGCKDAAAEALARPGCGNGEWTVV